MSKDLLCCSLIFRGFHKCLSASLGEKNAGQIWDAANRELKALNAQRLELDKDSKMMILPAAALYRAMQKYAPEQTMPLLNAYGTQVGSHIGKLIHALTMIPGVPELLWKNMPRLMRSTSDPKKGYTRSIVSETEELVGVDILSCPLHDAAIKIGVPEAALMVCAMDKAYMTGFRRIRYTRTQSVAEGGACCDYRLTYDRSKS